MENSQLLESLSNYVNSDDQFAVMIDGAWGSGKTYFLKNTVVPHICGEHKVVYFSVYGYESLAKLKSELIGKLFISSFGKNIDKEDQVNTKDIVPIVNEIGSAVWEKFSNFKTLAATTENYVINKRLRSQVPDSSPVLIIDDLERISRDIHTSDLMGFLLTDIIEPYGYRVIVVGNVKEIRDVEINEFNMTREKVVSRIFPFTYDFNNIRQEFFQDSGNHFLQEDSEWLVEIFAGYARRNGGKINLRTLEFILTTFTIIDRKLNQYWEGDTQDKLDCLQIKRSVFVNLFVIATEYREGNLTRENIVLIDRILNTRSFFFMHIKDDEEKSLAEEITLKYHDDNNLKQVIMYDNSVNEAVFSGVFDAAGFINSWMKLFRPIGKVSSLDEVANFRNMTDKQLEKLEQQILDDSQKQEISIKDILSTINTFLFFDQNDLYFCKENYLAVLLKVLKKAVDREVLKNKFTYDRGEISFMYSVISADDNILKQVYDILESGDKAQHEMQAEQLVVAIFDDNYELMRNIVHSNLNVNIFREVLDSSQLYSELLTVGSKANLLNQYLNSEYIQITNSKDFHSDENIDILELAQKVEEFLNESLDIGRIDMFNLRNLLKTLKKFYLSLVNK
ncbi:KAP family P-loop domain protein [Fructobacillus sp. EFB-N1]|uniref:P-loop NTPase fold protein n=1 Tax=Fructobacillus sp. EFB-N1 TaxID=1658766 RepID=UPI00065D991E|nr:P-loop NTPase fold protein [Fructobacillus sp. EFB-N1]KMK54211.1 KAP family P-loop domain protein [Fructobacillus sp. EFB-N1]